MVDNRYIVTITCLDESHVPTWHLIKGLEFDPWMVHLNRRYPVYGFSTQCYFCLLETLKCCCCILLTDMLSQI